MFQRLCKPLITNSFFLLGPRGTGKTSLLKEMFSDTKTLWIDLLSPKEEDAFQRSPDLLSERIREMSPDIQWIVIDEIQKVPRLLDVVHLELEAKKHLLFALTGSSARKLKREGANLLAGRAFMYPLSSLSFRELGDDFSIDLALQWGTLPKLFLLPRAQEKELFLDTYSYTYLKEEIIAEQLVRNVAPFRLFLEIAAQSNGEIINYSKIADDIRVDSKTVKTYYTILEDTLIGFLLPAYHRSVRKQQRTHPKFYFFDCGVKRALDRMLTVPLKRGTYAYGKAFEHFVILEIDRLNRYLRKNFRLSYLQTKDNAEIDLILERPGQPTALIEIKSSTQVRDRQLKNLKRFQSDIQDSEVFCLCQEDHPRRTDSIRVFPWQEGIAELGLKGIS